MLETILPLMRCPTCAGISLHPEEPGIKCWNCGAAFPVREGILDMVGGPQREVITPFQRIMQSPPIVRIYESIWRRSGYFLASSRSFDLEIDTVLRMSEGKNLSRVLDLACGPGVFTRPLAARSGGITIGLDLSWPMLRRANQLLRQKGIRNVYLIRGSAFHIPFADGVFPFINCCGALHLFDRPDAALAEIRRVAAPNGYLSVQTTIRPSRSAGAAYLLERFIRFGFFGEETLREMIGKHGFEMICSERHRISFTFLGRHIS